jgi:hydrogenase-4 component B
VSATLLQGLTTAMALLLLVAPLVSLRAARAGFLASFGCCAVGAVLTLIYLASGAAPAATEIPFGLAGQNTVLSIDGLSGLFLLLVMLAGAAASLALLDDHGHPIRTAPAVPVFVGSMMLCLLAADAFALVTGFEAMSVASFVLVLTQHREASVQAAGRLYIGMAVWSGLCLIAAVALLAPGGASFAAMRGAAHVPAAAWAVLALALLGPGSKAGLVPLHVWLPPAHASAPAPVSALMSGAMTKVALYVMIRLVFDLDGASASLWWGLPLIALGIASALLGSLRANMEEDIKTVLACSTIENVGLVSIGLGIALCARGADLAALSSLAAGAALLHVMAHGGFKTLLFLAAGAIQHNAGSRSFAALGGLIGRMPITSCVMLLAGASLAGLPPTPGFASEWMLFQSVLGSVRLGGLGLQIIAVVLAATLALATALAAAAAVRLIGVALLGRPRSLAAAQAHEAAPPLRWAMLLAALGVMMVGLFPGSMLWFAGPAMAVIVHGTMLDRIGYLGFSVTSDAPGYAPLFILLLIGIAVAVLWAALRAWAVQGHRAAPLWDCGFGDPPPWQPYGDPLAQYSATSFAQPLRRVLGTTLLGAKTQVFVPRPGDVSPARIAVAMEDPAHTWLLDPIARARAFVSSITDRLHFITVRQALSLMVFLLIALLVFIAMMEQL